MKRAALGGFVIMTMACAPVSPSGPGEEPVPVHGEPSYRCGSSPAQGLVGRQATSELAAEALRLTGAATLRWIPPGAVVTMDFREDRLNIELDDRQRVTQVRCG